MEIAVLDLGSTTFHLQHIRLDATAAFSTSWDEKRSICLGGQVFADGFLDRGSWQQGMTAAEQLLESARMRGPDHIAIVATSAIRSASNGERFVREFEQRNHIGVRVLAPQDEARLAYLGQSTSPLVGGRRVAVVDLGGGSVELAVGEGVRCLHASSLAIGAVRMRAMHGTDNPVASGSLGLLRAIRAASSGELEVVRQLQPEIIVFGSGSARAARKLLMRATKLPGKLGPIDATEFRVQLDMLRDCSQAQLVQLGVEPARAGTVLVAATVMLHVLDALGVPHALVSDKGLRDGVALEVYRALACGKREASSSAISA
jgi:exopolyphosphatase/guanosine-5'-triphosphate,3'-diphosphate pyrophosphatase